MAISSLRSPPRLCDDVSAGGGWPLPAKRKWDEIISIIWAGVQKKTCRMEENDEGRRRRRVMMSNPIALAAAAGATM